MSDKKKDGAQRGVEFRLVSNLIVVDAELNGVKKLTGALLLAVAAIFFVIITPNWAARSLNWSSILLTAALLIVPMISCGIALLRDGSSDSEKGDEVG